MKVLLYRFSPKASGVVLVILGAWLLVLAWWISSLQPLSAPTLAFLILVAFGLGWYGVKLVRQPDSRAHRTSEHHTGDARRWITVAAGFSAGTQVHTKNGLVSIEEIKLGDWVLAQPEAKGDTGYKRVTRTQSFDDQQVVCLVVYPVAESERAKRESNFIRMETLRELVVTRAHPFWVRGRGWTEAGNLDAGAEVELSNGEHALVSNISTIHRTETEDVGWFRFWDDDNFEEGRLIDFRGPQPRTDHGVDKDVPNSDFEFWKPENELHRKVYNLELEEHHTYYVGDLGVRVHDADLRSATDHRALDARHLDAQEPVGIDRDNSQDYFAPAVQSAIRFTGWALSPFLVVVVLMVIWSDTSPLVQRDISREVGYFFGTAISIYIGLRIASRWIEVDRATMYAGPVLAAVVYSVVLWAVYRIQFETVRFKLSHVQACIAARAKPDPADAYCRCTADRIAQELTVMELRGLMSQANYITQPRISAISAQCR